MNDQELSRAARTVPHLRQLVVFSLPDSQLLGRWPEGSPEAEGLAARMGTFVRASQVVAKSAGLQRSPRGAWLDTDEGAVLVVGLSSDRAVGFVFDEDAPLGLARLQGLELADRLRSLAAPVPAADLRAPAEDLGIPPAAEKPPPRAAAAELPTAIPEPMGPAAGPSATLIEASPMSGRPATVPPAASASVPASAPADDLRPRAVRLLEFLHRYAPDPHVTLLRLSLRTGIALEQLDRPEELNEGQVDQLAASVRDIIGQEQLGI